MFCHGVQCSVGGGGIGYSRLVVGLAVGIVVGIVVGLVVRLVVG